jgi:HD-GYP domain-containing protein (c-di-GMP phosphodiesterase class II)
VIVKGASPGTHRLRTHLNTLVIGLVVLAGLAIGGFGYKQIRDLALASAESEFQQLGQEGTATIEALSGRVDTLVTLLARGDLPASRSHDERMRELPTLAVALERNPRVSAVYAGYADGAFFLVRILRGDIGSQLGAPPGARFLVQSRSSVAASGVFLWLDDKLRVLSREARPEYRFDARQRPWYQAALASETPVHSEPYAFFTTGEIGKTFSQRSLNGRAVLGADFTLTALSRLLADRTRRLDASAQVVAFNDTGTLIANRDLKLAVAVADGERRSVTVESLKTPVLAEALRRASAGEVDRLLPWKEGDREWRILLTRLPEAGAHAEFLAAAIPVKALLAPADRALLTTLIVLGAILIVAIPFAWLVSHSVARPLERLAKEATAMRRFDFAEPAQPVRSRIVEVADVASSLTAARGAIQRFREVSGAVAAEQDFQKMVARVLDESLALASGSAGVLRLVTSDGAQLTTAVVRGADVRTNRLPNVGFDADLPAARALVQRRVTVETIEGTRMPPTLAAATNGQDATFVSVPFFDRRAQPLGVLSIARTGPAHRIDSGDDLIAFLAALAGTLAVAIENQKLLKEQKDLLEAFIQLVADAIDAKSPYTGGHCKRVPELTKMLAQAACDAKDGPFASYSLSEEQWEAVHIGAWLHDCGKVTTPEHVVDKATKLETICDRLHEIRMRFEVLKRDADIAYWKEAAGGGDKAVLAAKRDAAHRALDADFAFVAECNEGGEFMAPERVQRLKAIGARTWTRTLDDRIGLSNDERKRKAAVGSPPPPAAEKLLDDKPEHIVRWSASEILPAENKWGFKVKVPEHKWNRGEIYNLAIARGTLTEEERHVINDHMAQTIKMLTALPFPQHLRNVPEIAGGHHEKMDGTGYPKRLKRDEMSLPARMMAIADIFEALTAGDRPYKKAKTLSESLKIMGFMKKDKHIDPELFDLFLRSGVYLRYAERYCTAEQIDKVDIAPYLTPAG